MKLAKRTLVHCFRKNFIIPQKQEDLVKLDSFKL